MPGPTEDSGEIAGVSLFVIFCTVVNFFFNFGCAGSLLCCVVRVVVCWVCVVV